MQTDAPVRNFVSSGADVNTATDSGVAALTVAVHNGLSDIVKLLMGNNVDINADDRRYMTAFCSRRSTGVF